MLDNILELKRFFPTIEVLSSCSVINYPQESRRVKNRHSSQQIPFQIFEMPGSVAAVLAATGDFG